MTAIETLKQWFSNLKKPTQEQFWAGLDSFWHKSEKIPMASVEGLDKLVEGTASAEQLSNHLNDSNAHKALFDKKVDKVEGKELSSNDFTNEYKEKLEGLHQVDISGLLPKGGYEGTGRELKDAIDSLQTKMGQVETTLSVDDTDFDTLQEIATQVKSNKNLQTLLTKKVDKEDGKGLSTNDFTTTLKEKLEGISPFLGKFITGNLITGDTEFFPNLETGMEEWGSFTFQLFYPMGVGEYILSYSGSPLGEGMFINLIDTSNSEKEVVASLLSKERVNGMNTYFYLIKNEVDLKTGLPLYSNSYFSIKVKYHKDRYLYGLQLRKLETFPLWEFHQNTYVSYGLICNDYDVKMGRCNLVDTKGDNKGISIRYEENSLFSVVKIGDDVGKITFICDNVIEGNHEITGKAGSRAEGVCNGGKVYITVYNRE